MPNEPSSIGSEKSGLASRLAAMVKRSAELGDQMKNTIAKMQVLSEQMAREAARATKQADDARKRK